MTKPLQLSLAGNFTIDAAAEEGAEPRRTITGVALEYGVEVTDMWGTKARFEAGSLPLDGPAPKLIFENHYSVGGKAVGLVTERVLDGNQVLFAARISKTQLGDEALQLASDGVLDQVSVTATPTQYRYDGDVLVVESAEWSELALVPFGAFGDKAKVTQVAAAAPTTQPLTREEPSTMSTEETKIEAGAAEYAIVPTNPLQLAAVAAPKIDAATYLSYAVTGKNHPAIEAAQQGTGDTPGILPENLVGSVFDTLTNRRPFISAVGTLGMPQGGDIFNRRKITQHVDIDEQEAEFDSLASQKMTVSKIPVSKRTVGGVIELSEQDIDWSDPAAVSLVLRDMGNVYAKRTETLATAALVAGVTEELEVDFADGDEILDAFYDGGATINDVMDELPTHLFVATDAWATLGKAKAANGDRIFPAVGPMNAAGSMNPGSFTVAGLGLRVVVSNRFAPGTMILGHPLGIELYEQNKGSIRVEKPSTLSVELAWRGYFASLVIEPGAFVKLVAPGA